MTDHLNSQYDDTSLAPASRRGRFSRSLLTAIAVATLTYSTAHAATPSAETALKLEPVQADVDYEKVSSADAKRCVVQNIDEKNTSGWVVVGPDGSMLRRFADTNGDSKIDLWSYYKYGVEVYRDIDEDYDNKADQYRWLGTGGSRWGLDDDEDGRIDRWKQISAEEVSAELVASLRDSDPARFAAILIDESEIKSLGLGRTKTGQLTAKSGRAAKDFRELAKRQKAVGPNAKWVQFAASKPGVVPAGTDGSTKDVLVYENSVAMYEQDEKSGQLMVGTLIQVGDAWRLVELPSLSADGEAIAQTTGNFFTPGAVRPGNAGDSAMGEQTQRLVSQLEAIDQKFSTTDQKDDIEKLHAQRSDVIEALIAAAPDETERDTWVRQLVDTLSVAVQSGQYPDGVGRLRGIARKQAGDSEMLQAYADYEAINAEYVVRQTPEADFAKVQEWYLDALNGFVDRYPRTPEAARAWLQMALSKEFEDKESEALNYYKKVAANFRGTDAGEKALGAVRRLESVGQRIELEGDTMDGKTFKLSALRGKPVVIHYWATWCEPCKQDMKLLRRLQASYKRAGLQIVGVNVDGTRETASEFLKESSLPWVQLFEPGGLEDSGLAKSLGVQTLPTTLLIDAAGKVVRHNVRADELPNEIDEMLKKK
ncbi:TlpA family protein disulfide reductase [Rubripirellula amarantea]|nr:TlpA family protein disulfide reductase [Rubripirellula amarantea]